MALVLVDAQKRKVFPHPDPFVNLKAGGAGLAIYIYLSTHTVSPPCKKMFISD